ncbi:uncharacterized protein LOC131257879 isoform X2 [Magnolia sinica]|uniref:uncharacterized protein LOC131257879 isoform X2 n=1 Tax=Magnolia sinica TaxID=86752 RepID=UPI0026595B45|nr:uncharacterized protein LOC131257879 isoform X2 [Magnolia sinica]
MKRVSSRDSAMLSLPLRQQLTSLSAFATSHTVRVMRAEIDMVFLVHAYAAAWFLVVPSHWTLPRTEISWVHSGTRQHVKDFCIQSQVPESQANSSL